MEKLVCYAYKPESWFTLDADVTRETRCLHTVILAGNAVTHSDAECRLPLYSSTGARQPRFFPPTSPPPGGWENAYLLFSKIRHLTATPGRLLTFPPLSPTFEVGLGGIMITYRVEMKGLSSLTIESDEEVVSMDPGGEGSVVVSDMLPECYYPTLIFKSWAHDGSRLPNVEFSWRLEGEMIFVMKRRKAF